jgi:DNA-binding protein H-NS
MKDLSKYSLAQLRTLEAQVDEELKSRHYLGVSKAREQILHIARGAGISVDDLLSGKALKTPAPAGGAPKYRNPDDPSQQWTGRGRQPNWVKAWIASGKSVDDAKV